MKWWIAAVLWFMLQFDAFKEDKVLGICRRKCTERVKVCWDELKDESKIL